MATVPSVVTSVSQTAGAPSGGLDVCCIFAPCATSADMVPRLFGSSSSAYAQHGYCEGVEYADYHATKTGKSFLFVGLPIVTVGVVGRENTGGNTGGSVSRITAGASGVLAEHDGVIRVVTGGTVGTDQIRLEISLDGGRKFVPVRLGTASSYTIPYVGVGLTLDAGTLVAGDTIHTWHGTAPRSDSTAWATARANLAAQQKAFRSVVLLGDLQTHTEAQAFLDQIEAYKTSNKRFVYARAGVRDRLPVATLSHVTARMTGTPTLTFAEVGATGDTCTRNAGSWIADGFAVGDTVTFAGTASNNVSGVIASLSATVITMGATDFAAEVIAVTGLVTVVATPTLTFAEVGVTGDTATRNRGSWLDDGFRVGDTVTFAGTASNNVTGAIASLSATVLTFGATDLAAEVIGVAAGVTCVTGESKAVWAAAIDSEFSSVNSADGRLDLSMGRGRKTSGFTGWNMRRPAWWFASAREYQHDLHIATWRKSDGPVDAGLFDEAGNLVEWDDRDDVDGGAASAGRFTSLRTWSNGPAGAFVTLSLTRAPDGSLLTRTHNVAVVNEICRIVQLMTETAAVGQSLILNLDGTATKASLAVIEGQINAALELGVLVNKQGEGPRASHAVCTIDPSGVYNVDEPTMTTVTDTQINGTVHKVVNTVRLRSGGQ